MAGNGYEKTEEELLKERAEALGRTGLALSEVLEKLSDLDFSIRKKTELLQFSRGTVTEKQERARIKEINEEIRVYNVTRKQAQLRYYYLIVTREAVGFRKHKWVEEVYRIPPVKRPISLSETEKPKERKTNG